MKTLVSILITMLNVFGSAGQSQPAATTFIITRHAEKASSEPDCELSDNGKQRAEALKQLLSEAKIDAVFATPYKRTHQTVKPLADKLSLQVQEYSTRTPYEELVSSIISKYGGKTVLLAGHSNTIPKIIAALNIEQQIMIEESHFDNLYIVYYRPGEKSQLLRLKYGKMTQ